MPAETERHRRRRRRHRHRGTSRAAQKFQRILFYVLVHVAFIGLLIFLWLKINNQE